jgi:cell division protein ZapA (FtsZ GTPase activity inhibitor)
MTEPEKTSIPVELDIYGHSFRLRAPTDEHDRIKRAARHVDNVLRELVVSQTTPDTGRLAIQAAFLITLDYLKLMDDIHQESGITDEVKRRVDDLTRRLDESLRTL